MLSRVRVMGCHGQGVHATWEGVLRGQLRVLWKERLLRQSVDLGQLVAGLGQVWRSLYCLTSMRCASSAGVMCGLHVHVQTYHLGAFADWFHGGAQSAELQMDG